jgi:hypothetical protein
MELDTVYENIQHSLWSYYWMMNEPRLFIIDEPYWGA